MKNKVNILSALFVAFFLTSCSTIGSYNQPFINTDETLKISEGMTKELVLMNVGQPYFVESGANDTEIWVYNVRTIMVMSDVTKSQPNKDHPQTKHANMHHELQIIFKNGKVISWGPYSMSGNESNVNSKDNQNVSDQEVETKSSSARKFSIGPRMGIVGAEVLNFDSGLAFGAHIGYGSYGLELISYESDDSDYLFSMMLTKTISSSKFNIHTGLGFNSVEGVYDDYYDWDYDYDFAEGLFVRLGAGYPISFGSIAIEPMITLNLGLGDGNGWSGALINLQYGG
tara:strand:+ start:133 stop:987 length:855 start_codon:yes stop_codon:yes gene_type:complete